MVVYQAFRFELDPNDVARSALASHAGAARFAYNWGLATVTDRLDARRALRVLALRQGASTDEAGAWATELVGPVPWNLPGLRRAWNQAKAEVAPWWAENSKEAYNSGLDALARALDGWSKSRRGQRKGRRVGFPRYHKRGSRRSWRVTTGALSFGCQVDRKQRPAPSGPPVGVDAGVKSLAVLSSGEVVPNPKHLSKWARRQARLQRQCARRAGPAKGRAPSKRWWRSKARLARTHAKVATARSDGLHKLTTRLATTNATVVVEDLGLAGMTATAKGSGHWRGKAGLNRAILDAAPGELRRQLSYKTTWYGSRLVVADRWYPSSKTCSRCKAVKAKLALSERTFWCERCGLVIDRDLNAATNLASLVEAYSITGTASGAGTSTPLPPAGAVCANAQGEEMSMAPARCSSTNREAGTGAGRSDKTVTATRQRVAPKPVLVQSDR